MPTAPTSRGIWKSIAFVAAVACGGAGCSLAFVNGPPPNHQRLPFFDCSSSNVLPTVDLVLAGLATVDAIGGSAGTSGLATGNAEVAAFAVEAAVFAASAAYGYSKTSSCRKAQEEMFKRAALNPSFAPGYPNAAPGFAPPPRVPYDPWVAPPPPAGAPPPALSPLGPSPAEPSAAAPRPAPATDTETPAAGKPIQ